MRKTQTSLKPVSRHTDIKVSVREGHGHCDWWSASHKTGRQGAGDFLYYLSSLNSLALGFSRSGVQPHLLKSEPLCRPTPILCLIAHHSQSCFEFRFFCFCSHFLMQIPALPASTNLNSASLASVSAITSVSLPPVSPSNQPLLALLKITIACNNQQITC